MLFYIIWAIWVHLILKSVFVTAGARWDIQGGTIAEARLKELTPSMPVIAVRAIPNDRQETRNTYECPVYKTKLRANTYIWTFSLKTRERPSKWVLAGVALLLSVWCWETLMCDCRNGSLALNKQSFMVKTSPDLSYSTMCISLNSFGLI